MKYTQAQIQAGVKFLQNKNVSFDIESNEHTSEMVVNMNIAVNDKIWTDGTSIWNNNVVKGVKVDSINLVSTYYDDDEDAYWSGGLSGTISYDGSGKDGTWYDGGDVETQLINKIKDEQDSDGMIYTDSGFIANSIKYMEQHCDFDAKLLSDFLDFDYSEQGMQDDGAVNLDVELDGHFWIKCNDELVKFVNTKVA
tara:strand:+ start:275 stop:862 length:588 start_codon:yes stop_codon:yes gene_type:complete